MPNKRPVTSMSIEPAKPKTFTDQNLEPGFGLGGANNVKTPNAKPGGTIAPGINATPKMNTFGKDKLISMKDGGKVPETGPYKLHKGETVIPAKKGNNMADKKPSSKMDAATKGLGAPDAKAPRAKKTTHMHIEPTDNKGFIVKHVDHENGVPTGKTKQHVFTKAKDMHAHVAKTFPMSAADAIPAPAAPPAPDAAAPAAVPAPGVGAPPLPVSA